MAAATQSRNKIYALGVVVFLALVSLFYYLSAPVYLYIVAYMWFGFLYGILQQYGRFCMASAWRDLIMIKVPRMFVGIMIGLMTLSIIAALIFVLYPERYHVYSIGFHVLIGGLIFGLGMVLAGGCATGSLYKTGEGNMISLTVLLSLSFAQAIFAATLYDPIYNAFIKGKTLDNISLTKLLFGGGPEKHDYTFMQHLIGDAFVNAIAVGLVLLIGVYVIVVRKGFLKRRTKEIAATVGATADGGAVKMGLKDELAGFWSMISSSRRTSIAAILIGIVAAFQVFSLGWMGNQFNFKNFGQVLTGVPGTTAEEINKNKAAGVQPPASWPKTKHESDVSKSGTVFDPGYWYITTQEAMFAGWLINTAGVDMTNNSYFGDNNGLPRPWLSPALLLSFGLILGASFLALINREFKWKFPTRELFLFAVAGGTIMGIGSRIALGCNIGAFYAPAAFGNPSGWIFFIGMGLGAYGSAKFVNWWTERKMAALDFDIEL